MAHGRATISRDAAADSERRNRAGVGSPFDGKYKLTDF